MDVYIVYTVDADNKKSIWKKMYSSWDTVTDAVKKAAESRYKVYVMNFISVEKMKPVYESVTSVEAEKRPEGILYAHLMNDSYRFYIMKMSA